MKKLAVLVLIVCTMGCTSGRFDSQVGNFEFVSPGGKTEIYYPKNKRKPLADVQGELLNDASQTFYLSKFDHHPVVINIWAQWCAPCRAEANLLQRTFVEYTPRGVNYLGIDFRDDRDAALNFERERQIDYPSIFDPSGRSLLAIRNFPASSIPSTLFLDASHQVVKVFLRPVSQRDIEKTLDDILREPQS